MDKVPIVFFAYNRPEHTKRSLEALSRCDRFDECDLYIFCDGPKDDSQKEKVEALRQVVKIWAKKLNAKVVARSENLGLARSIVTGVTELCKEKGRVIVLEDDLVVSQAFLDYMLQALERYKDCENVYQVSGYMFPVSHPPEADTFFLPFITTWGWATWGRAWSIFDWEATGALAELSNRDQRKAFDLGGNYPYYGMLQQRFAGQNDSWGILWWWAVFKARGYVLYPRKSFVRVGGFDGSGTHCRNEPLRNQMMREPFDLFNLSTTFSWPGKIEYNEKAFKRIKFYLRNQNNGFLGSIMKRVFSPLL